MADELVSYDTRSGCMHCGSSTFSNECYSAFKVGPWSCGYSNVVSSFHFYKFSLITTICRDTEFVDLILICLVLQVLICNSCKGHDDLISKAIHADHVDLLGLVKPTFGGPDRNAKFTAKPKR